MNTSKRTNSLPKRHSAKATLGPVALLMTLAVLAAQIGGCSDGTTPGEPGKSIDDNGGTAWSTAAPATLGFDAEKLNRVRDYAFEDDQYTQAVIVIRHGQIAAEWYQEGHDKDSWATSWSVAKSYASTLIGIAIDEGLIDSVDASIVTWIPEWKDTPKERITLKHVLGMATGLDYTENFDLLGDNDVRDMLFEPDQLAFALQQTAETAPGSEWYYNSANTLLLTRVIEQATGKSMGDYAQEKLFEPLQMTKAEWWEDGAGYTLAYCCIDTTSRDFARLGQLFLQKGRWAGQQIVSAEWVAESTRPSQNAYAGYGYKWWLNSEEESTVDAESWPSMPLDTYAALGRDFQLIYVIPSQDMVVVRNGEYIKPDHPPRAPNGLFEAGLHIHGLGTTGSKGPLLGTWSDDTFIRLALDALVE